MPMNKAESYAMPCYVISTPWQCVKRILKIKMKRALSFCHREQRKNGSFNELTRQIICTKSHSKCVLKFESLKTFQTNRNFFDFRFPKSFVFHLTISETRYGGGRYEAHKYKININFFFKFWRFSFERSKISMDMDII